MVQQSRKSLVLVPSRCLVHPYKCRRQGSPALRPDPGGPTQVPLGPVPSLHRFRNPVLDVVQRFPRYCEPVRLPASARPKTLVVPCLWSPSATIPMVPAGPPGFRQRPFLHDAVLDPGGAMSSRLATTHMLPSLTGINSASTRFYLSRLSCHTLQSPCLRFEPYVTATPARLGPGLPATALAGQDFHL